MSMFNKSWGFGRREFLANLFMVIGVLAGYGLGAGHFLRYLVPMGRKKRLREMFVGTLASIPVGVNLNIKEPNGREINLLRISDDQADPAVGFKALSSKCPHLGCRVHWESSKGHFLCPCHEGIFDREGIAQSGPPADEGKNLSVYPVRVDKSNGWVFVMVSGDSPYGV
jgi:cytochrome b6-f complex iron-sulfur subunit